MLAPVVIAIYKHRSGTTTYISFQSATPLMNNLLQVEEMAQIKFNYI